MAECGLTWSQYRMLNSILFDVFGTGLLATELDMRRNMKLDNPTPIDCGEAEVTDRHGNKRMCSFSRVVDLFDAIEKEVAALFESGMINKDLDVDGSPYRYMLAVKFMGDKGGRSTK